MPQTQALLERGCAGPSPSPGSVKAAVSRRSDRRIHPLCVSFVIIKCCVYLLYLSWAQTENNAPSVCALMCSEGSLSGRHAPRARCACPSLSLTVAHESGTVTMSVSKMGIRYGTQGHVANRE